MDSGHSLSKLTFKSKKRKHFNLRANSQRAWYRVNFSHSYAPFVFYNESYVSSALPSLSPILAPNKFSQKISFVPDYDGVSSRPILDKLPPGTADKGVCKAASSLVIVSDNNVSNYHSICSLSFILKDVMTIITPVYIFVLQATQESAAEPVLIMYECSLVCSSIHSSIHPSICSAIHLSIHSFVRSFIHLPYKWQ